MKLPEDLADLDPQAPTRIDMKLTHYIHEKLIFTIEAENRDTTLKQAILEIQSRGFLADEPLFLDAVMARENMVSTAIGSGVAIPHARLNSCKNFFISIVILKKGIDWNALDHMPVNLLLIIAGPNDKQTEYLHLLSQLTLFLRDSNKSKAILQATNSQEVLDLFESEKPPETSLAI